MRTSLLLLRLLSTILLSSFPVPARAWMTENLACIASSSHVLAATLGTPGASGCVLEETRGSYGNMYVTWQSMFHHMYVMIDIHVYMRKNDMHTLFANIFSCRKFSTCRNVNMHVECRTCTHCLPFMLTCVFDKHACWDVENRMSTCRKTHVDMRPLFLMDHSLTPKSKVYGTCP